MPRVYVLAAVATLGAVIVAGLLGASAQPSPSTLIVVTAAESGPPSSSGLIPGASVASLEPGEPTPRAVIDGFAAIGLPRVSYDGQRILFSARLKAEDPIRLWEARVDGSAPRELGPIDGAIDPAYLPDGRLVYSRSPSGEPATTALYSFEPQQELRLTFGSARDRSPAVLDDGRIVFRRQRPGKDEPGRLFVVRTDGTGFTLFYEPKGPASIVAGPWVVGDRVIFVEKPDGPGEIAELVAVEQTRPLAGRTALARGEMVSHVSAVGERGLAIGRYWPQERQFRVELAQSEPIPSLLSKLPSAAALIPVAATSRPLKLTSVVDREKKTGRLLCLDVRSSREESVSSAVEIERVRVLTDEGIIGEAAVRSDGSFLLEVPADRQLRLQLLGPSGVIAAERSGFWVRPNETRGCIGCHEDQELAPENRFVEAIEHDPVPVGVEELS